MQKMITSPHNEKLKLIRKLHERKHRERTGMFAAEGEDLIEAAEHAGVPPEFVLGAGRDVEPALLDAVSALGSGTRVIGVYRQRWSEPAGSVRTYLHGVGDPGNVGTIIRAAHALADGPVVLGADCPDPYSPKAVRASMGSIFACPPARGELHDLEGFKLGLDARAEKALGDVEIPSPVTLCLGAEREGLPPQLESQLDASARIPIRPHGPDSLNVAIAAALALYEVANRMAARA